MDRALLAAACTLALCACARGIDPALAPADLDLPSPAPPVPALPDGVSVRALTFNIHGGQEASAAAIGALIASLAPTFASIEECPDAYAEPLAAASGLPHHAYQDGKLLLSRTPLREAKLIALETRSVLHAVTELEGVPFSLYAVHIGWNAAGARQARLFVDEHLAKDPIAHVVAMGDYNDEHGSVQIGILEEVIADAFTALGWYAGQRISWPSTGFDGSEGSQLIDLIFFRKSLAPIAVGGDVVNLTPVLSDHKPAWADLLYPRGPAPFASDPLAPSRQVSAGWPSPPPPNLLVNPGGEEGMRGWTVPDGEGATTAAERLHQRPRSGAAFFTGAERLPGGLVSSASQVVSLADRADAIDARRVELLVSGWITTGYEVEVDGAVVANRPRPYDDAEVIVEALDEAGALLARWSSGRRDTLSWTAFSGEVPVPPGARQARLTWMAHRKEASGLGSDGAIDDLYLGVHVRAEPHALLEGSRVDPEGFVLERFERRQSGESVGAMLYAPWSWSGRDHFYAGGVLGLEETPHGAARMSEAFAASRSEGQALCWGGWLRTYAGQGSARLELELIEEGGRVWGTIATDPVTAAEWTHVERRTRIPDGTWQLRLSVVSEGPTPLSATFADELYAYPEAP